ncbi:hypothetical protein PR202_ga21009 [Eleusine coracana subsp. coracana]|uniref:CCZ1/INTU/HSP4 first Longin domain-containing protein n=1 Tax=Eleusine coracana subsp. coracana TaxID=191504 RepID=A0AAV5CY29_ELECO|nr:hypothetical protein PR202_ga21009 [Eleusine coracana subsp. coracana]
MGLTSTASGDGAQLCVFDLRRGQQEGQELDKILFFHPTDCPILLQLSVIGLCEGIVTFTRSPSRSPSSFTISLKERGTVQMLTVSREVALEVQDDTLNLYTYAVMRLTPRALSSNASSWSYLRKGTSISAGPTASSSNGTTAGERYHSRSRDTSPGGQNQINYNFRPLLREKLSKGKDGFVIADFTATEGRAAVPLTPILWFQQAEEHMHLCIYQHKNLTVLLLIPASSLVNGEEGIAHVKKHLLENASQKIATVEQKLARGWGGENAYHVSGYRYLLVDPDRRVSRASPPGKVTTLSRVCPFALSLFMFKTLVSDSLLSLNRLRQEVDLEKSRHNRSDPSHDKDFEACIRTKNNAWVIAKVTRGKELYMALEKGGETLLYASTAVEKFSNRYCEGAFSTD